MLVIRNLYSVALLKAAIAISLSAVWLPEQAQARDCVSTYNSILQYIRDNRSVFSVLGNAPDETKQRFERQLKACIPNERSSENRAKSLKLLARVLRAQGKNRATEAVQTYRRAISTWSWGTTEARKMEKDIADIYYAHERWADFVDQSAMLLRRYSSFQSDQRFRANRGYALKKIGNRREAITEYLAAARLDDGPKKPYEAKEALTLMQELYRRTSCSVLDSHDLEAPNFLTKAQDCLTSRRLPAVDIADAHDRIARHHLSQKNFEGAGKAFKAMLSVQSAPPTYSDLDRANRIFYSMQEYPSAARVIIVSEVQRGEYSSAITYFRQFAQDYANFLHTLKTTENDYEGASYQNGSNFEERQRIALSTFLGPTVDALTSNGQLDMAVNLLDQEMRRSFITRDNQTMLVFSKAQLRARAEAFEDAIVDYTIVLSNFSTERAEVSGTRQTALYERAISYQRLGKYAEARIDMDSYFSALPDNWHEGQVSNQLGNAFIFRIEMTALAGDKTAAERQISTLQTLYDRFNQECAPCAGLRGLLD